MVALLFAPGAVPAQQAVSIQRELSLDEALHRALIKNFKIRLAVLDRRAAQQDLTEAQARYDTTLSLSTGYSVDKREQTSSVFGDRATKSNFTVGLDKKLPTGTEVGVDWTNERETSNSSFATNDKLYTSQFKISATQPLLKNFLGIIDRGTVKLTANTVSQIDLQTLTAIEATLAEVSSQYFAWVEARKAVTIQQQALDRAQELLQINQEKKDRGAVEDVDIFASEANVESRRSDLVLAVEHLATTTDRLAFLLQIDGLTAYAPSDSLETEPQTFSVGDAIQVALANRRDIQEAELELEKAELEARMASNARLPELNLFGSAAGNRLDDHFGGSRADTFSDERPVYEVGLLATVPLENRDARAKYRKAVIRRDQAAVKLNELKERVALEIKEAVRKVQTQQENARIRQGISTLQEQKLNAEGQQFELGRRRAVDVIEFQQDLFTAQLQENRSLLDYRQALIDLQRAKHRLILPYQSELPDETG